MCVKNGDSWDLLIQNQTKKRQDYFLDFFTFTTKFWSLICRLQLSSIWLRIHFMWIWYFNCTDLASINNTKCLPFRHSLEILILNWLSSLQRNSRNSYFEKDLSKTRSLLDPVTFLALSPKQIPHKPTRLDFVSLGFCGNAFNLSQPLSQLTSSRSMLSLLQSGYCPHHASKATGAKVTSGHLETTGFRG